MVKVSTTKPDGCARHGGAVVLKTLEVVDVQIWQDVLQERQQPRFLSDSSASGQGAG